MVFGFKILEYITYYYVYVTLISDPQKLTGGKFILILFAPFVFLLAESTVYICDFHQEQAWVCWTNNSKHGVPVVGKGKVLASLRAMAKAATVNNFDSALNSFKRSEPWL